MNTFPRQRRRGWIAWPCGLAFLIVLYLASLGPWSYILFKGVLPARIEGALMLMYSPIQLLDERTSFFDDNPFGRSYKEYVVWWVDRAREP